MIEFPFQPELIVLDRDGVINHDSANYIRTPEDWHSIDGSIEAIARLQGTGFKVAVATNQSGIARGYLDVDTLDAIHQKMVDAIIAAGGTAPVIAYCPHLPDSDCTCRKPAPGLLLSLCATHQVSPRHALFVGDKISDQQAAEAAGCMFCFVTTGLTVPKTKSKLVLTTLSELVNHLQETSIHRG